MVVANDPWQKSGERPVTPAADRLAMVEAAVEGLDGIVASDLELRRGGPELHRSTPFVSWQNAIREARGSSCSAPTPQPGC